MRCLRLVWSVREQIDYRLEADCLDETAHQANHARRCDARLLSIGRRDNQCTSLGLCGERTRQHPSRLAQTAKQAELSQELEALQVLVSYLVGHGKDANGHGKI